jgi:hypothetical protein
LLVDLARQFWSSVSRLTRISGASNKVGNVDLVATRVEDSGPLTAQPISAMADVEATADTPVVSSATQRQKRFRRTSEEMRLGLSIYEAMAARQNKLGHGVVGAIVSRKGVEFKAKRFRRTQEELRLGLSIEEATRRRAAPGRQEKVEAKATTIIEPKPAKRGSVDLFHTLTPQIQARANAVSRYRARGGKAVLTAETLDMIEKAVSAGRVKVCPPFIDSDGFNHLTGQEAK